MKRSLRARQVAALFFGLIVIGSITAPAASLAAPPPPSLYDLNVVEMTGRPGHEGLFPIQGQPIVNSAAIVRTRVLGTLSNVTLLIRDTSGNLLSSLPMIVPPAGTTVPGTYFADITVPSQPFSLSVSGQTASGGSLKLAPPQGGTVAPQTLGVGIQPTVGVVPAGVPILFTVQATNYGAAGTFTVSFTDSLHGTVSPPTQSVALAPSGTASVTFTDTAPSGVSFMADTFTATATSQTNPSLVNSATLTLQALMGPAPVAISGRLYVAELYRRDPQHSHPSALWLCNTSVNPSSLLIDGTPLQPISVKIVDLRSWQHENNEEWSESWRERECKGSALLELSYSTSAIWAVLGVSAPGKGQSPPKGVTAILSGDDTAGNPLFGYAPAVFEHERHREGY